MRIRLINESDQTAWDAALEGVPHGIAHTNGFASLMAEAQGMTGQLLVAEGGPGNNARAVMPISVRQFRGHLDLVSPYGFGGFVGRGDLNGLRNAWNDFANAQAYVAAYLLQNPVLTPEAVPAQWGRECFFGRDAFIVDLTLPEADRMPLVSRRKKTALQRWLATIEIEQDQARLAEAFIALYPDFAERRKMSQNYCFSAQTLRRLVDLPETRLVGVRDNQGEIACVAVFSALPACGDYLFMASRPGAAEHGFGTLWLGLRALAEMGVKMCNLGGGIRAGDGVAEMKRRIGGQPRKIVAIQQVFDPEAYRSLCETVGVSGNDSTYFPAYYGQPKR